MSENSKTFNSKSIIDEFNIPKINDDSSDDSDEE